MTTQNCDNGRDYKVILAACPSGSLGGTFVEFLNQAGTFAVSNGTLTIELMADGGAMTFVAT